MNLLLGLYMTLAVAPGDSIEWAPATPLVPDCTEQVTQPVCRERRVFTREELQARLDAGREIWPDGDALTFVHSAPGPGVLLGGGVQTMMSTLVGTDLRFVTVRIPRLDEAVISWFFVPLVADGDRAARFVPQLWRGRLAPAAPDSVSEVRGTTQVDTIISTHLAGARAVHVYIPPARGRDPIGGVVYAGDGNALQSFADVLEPLMAAGRLPRLLLVGVAHDASRPAAGELDGRSAEYLLNAIPGDERFLAHERFFIEEVVPLVRTRYGAPADRSTAVIAGFSNSAALAISLGMRHHELFGTVIAMSPGGAGRPDADGLPAALLPQFYLTAGVLEGGFHRRAVAWAEELRARNVSVKLDEPVAGHDSFMWREQLAGALQWAFGR